jgi:hypothetical protein
VSGLVHGGQQVLDYADDVLLHRHVVGGGCLQVGRVGIEHAAYVPGAHEVVEVARHRRELEELVLLRTDGLSLSHAINIYRLRGDCYNSGLVAAYLSLAGGVLIHLGDNLLTSLYHMRFKLLPAPIAESIFPAVPASERALNSGRVEVPQTVPRGLDLHESHAHQLILPFNAPHELLKLHGCLAIGLKPSLSHVHPEPRLYERRRVIR